MTDVGSAVSSGRAGGLTVVLVTGFSGAGKSTALRVFEDLGFFCVDGLPASMVPKLVGLFRDQKQRQRGLALGMDLRQHDFVDEWMRAAQELEHAGVKVQTLFLEARLETLVRRYATTRRPHPLESRELGLDQALDLERELLEPVRRRAEMVVDTTMFSIHDLRRRIQERWASLEEQENEGLRIHMMSFGFKHGVPSEADLIFDLRFLPNPYFEEELRALSGKDKPVAEYVLGSDPGLTFKDRLGEFLEYLLPLYAQEGRYRLTLAMGCTGGRHRSVAVAEYMFARLRKAGYTVTKEHRHIDLA